ncbi:GNAT family N-acetyltransferase [Halostreptopolyspora alba]|uniref:GNAT family N-acetyltransferase n=1 Tax=Halostreptopolyspora alba TaxID=2487137 RepID=A0A3N0DRK4_9ACTN|nr:GNAT family N-acetyltransferase [Nocardiopsaceae bacterium YIM 96095]
MSENGAVPGATDGRAGAEPRGGGPKAVDGGVELVRLDSTSPGIQRLRSQVRSVPLLPGQHRFVKPAAHTLPRADADPNRTPFAVVVRDTAVGFGILDRGGNLVELTPTPRSAVLFRAFHLAPEWQGRGVGRAVCVALDPLVRAVAPEATEVLLTVNEANPAAIRAYLAGGFRDSGRRYLGGDAGPQLILYREVTEYG